MKISVVGSINMDMTVTADRIPLRGETLLGDTLSYIPGGKGANQAVAMGRLSPNIEMFGCVGNDGAGTALIKNLKDQGVETRHISIIKDEPTGIALITVGENDNTIIVVQGANKCVDCDYIDHIKTALLESDMVVLQQEIPSETVDYVVALCEKEGIQTILNPAPARTLKKATIEKATYLTPNEHEAAILFGSEQSIEELLAKYPEKLVITQGSKGVITCLQSGEILSVPARKACVVDTTGAGDTLNGAFAVCLADGADMKEALMFANTAASLSTEKFGAQTGMPTRDEVITELGW